MARRHPSRVDLALVEAWFDHVPPDARALLQDLHAAIGAAEPALAPAVKWGHLVYSLDGRHLLALVPHRSHVNLQVFNGQLLADPWPELVGTGKLMRHWKLAFSARPDAERLARLVGDAAAEQRRSRPADDAGHAAPTEP